MLENKTNLLVGTYQLDGDDDAYTFSRNKICIFSQHSKHIIGQKQMPCLLIKTIKGTSSMVLRTVISTPVHYYLCVITIVGANNINGYQLL